MGARSRFPRQSGKGAGLAVRGCGGARRRWRGSFNLPGGGGGEKRACERGGAAPRAPQVPSPPSAPAPNRARGLKIALLA